MSSSSSQSPVVAPGPGMSAQAGTAPAGATTGIAAGFDGFAFPQLPPQPASAPRAYAPRAGSPQGQREQAESIVNSALAEAERIRDVARAEATRPASGPRPWRPRSASRPPSPRSGKR